MYHRQVDPLVLVAGFFTFFMLSRVLLDVNDIQAEQVFASSDSQEQAISVLEHSSPVVLTPEVSQASMDALDMEVLLPPYEYYAVTQGPHGFSYGHAAIDLSAGRGAVVLSPINGVVTQLYIDDLGNTTLVIENDRYQVILLHGIYTVAVGDVVRAGQAVGQESNQGNTVDAYGNSCRGRDCGYHTHLNVYDKLLGININPLELWQ